MGIRAAGYTPNIQRTNRPVVSGNYLLAETDLGVVMTTPDTCNFPAYSVNQLGKEYSITNHSSGSVIFMPFVGEFVIQKGQSFSSVVIPSGESRQVARETTGRNLVIV